MLAGHMLRDWPASPGYFAAGHADEVISMLSSLTQLHDTIHVDTFLSAISVKGLYHGSENEALTRAFWLLAPERTAELMGQIISANAQMMPGTCADLLARASEGTPPACPRELLQPVATALVETFLGQRASASRPGCLRRPAPIEPALIVDLLTALDRIDLPLLAGRVVEHVLGNPASFGMDAIIVPAVLDLTECAPTAHVASVQHLRAACLAHLRGRIAEPLEPPADFARVNTVSCRCVHCAELGRFLVDPGRKEWALKAAQHSRSHVESAIRQHGCDLDCATRRVGSPHSLVCTKNQASYKQRVRQRKDDLQNVKRLDIFPTRMKSL